MDNMKKGFASYIANSSNKLPSGFKRWAARELGTVYRLANGRGNTISHGHSSRSTNNSKGDSSTSSNSLTFVNSSTTNTANTANTASTSQWSSATAVNDASSSTAPSSQTRFPLLQLNLDKTKINARGCLKPSGDLERRRRRRCRLREYQGYHDFTSIPYDSYATISSNFLAVKSVAFVYDDALLTCINTGKRMMPPPVVTQHTRYIECTERFRRSRAALKALEDARKAAEAKRTESSSSSEGEGRVDGGGDDGTGDNTNDSNDDAKDIVSTDTKDSNNVKDAKDVVDVKTAKDNDVDKVTKNTKGNATNKDASEGVNKDVRDVENATKDSSIKNNQDANSAAIEHVKNDPKDAKESSSNVKDDKDKDIDPLKPYKHLDSTIGTAPPRPLPTKKYAQHTTKHAKHVLADDADDLDHPVGPLSASERLLEERLAAAHLASDVHAAEAMAGGGLDFALFVTYGEESRRALERVALRLQQQKLTSGVKIGSYEGPEREHTRYRFSARNTLPPEVYSDFGTSMSGCEKPKVHVPPWDLFHPGLYKTMTDS